MQSREESQDANSGSRAAASVLMTTELYQIPEEHLQGAEAGQHKGDIAQTEQGQLTVGTVWKICS